MGYKSLSYISDKLRAKFYVTPLPNNALYFSVSSSTASSILAFKNIFSDSDNLASLSQSNPF